MGKTVLLKRFSEEAERRGWVLLGFELDRRFGYEGEVVALITAACRRKAEALSILTAARRRVTEVAGRLITSINLTVGDFTANLDPRFREVAIDLERSLTEVLEAASSAGKAGCLLTVDEAQYLADDAEADEYPLSLLLAMVSAMQAAQLPIALVLSGLPALDRLIGTSRPQAERLFRELRVGRLDDTATAEALAGPLRGTAVSCTPGVVARALPLIDGYPHFVQVYGAELWDAARAAGSRRIGVPLFRATAPRIAARIEADIYDFRMRQLDPPERDLLIDSARQSGPPFSAASLVSAGRGAAEVERVIGRLLDLGIIWDPSDRGEFVYTVPGFRDYLVRRASDWSATQAPGTGPLGV
jgi:hypothetical protein